MMDFILGWVLGKRILEQNNNNNSPEEKLNVPMPKQERKPMLIYEYWPAFDNEIPTLDEAYKLYEDNHVCHLNKGGICKCYFEFDGDDSYIKTDPRHFFENI